MDKNTAPVAPEEKTESYADIKKIIQENKERKRKRDAKRMRKTIIIPSAIITTVVVCYLLVAFSNIPFISYWRGIWIETAMTTKSHQWLATALFPESVVRDVMANFTTNSGVVGGADGLKDNTPETAPTVPKPEEPVNTDPLDQQNLVVGGKDYAGNTVLVNDIEEGIVISEIIGNGYRGQILFVDDPSRVFIGHTVYKDNIGMRILDMMDEYGAVAGTNASGFYDSEGEGLGGSVVGLSASNGEFWGEYDASFASMVLTTDNKLVVGNIGDWGQYNIRDGMQFYPVLIADGVKQVKGSGGYGLQPRTAVGQRADGAICFLVIDGRNPTWSIGCTVGDLADILESYNIINAACCDGGASCCIAYDGKLTTKNCSLNPTIGRLLPNAFLVRSKTAESNGETTEETTVTTAPETTPETTPTTTLP